MNPNPSGERPAPPAALTRQPKTLAEMSFAELSAELEAAKQQYASAAYQDQLSVMQSQQEAASARIAATEEEIERRIARLDAGGGVPLFGMDFGEERNNG